MLAHLISRRYWATHLLHMSGLLTSCLDMYGVRVRWYVDGLANVLVADRSCSSVVVCFLLLVVGGWQWQMLGGRFMSYADPTYCFGVVFLLDPRHGSL